MGTRSSRIDVGRQRARDLAATALRELRTARQLANVSQEALAARLGWAQSTYSDFERGKRPLVLDDLAAAAALLGLDVSLSLRARSEGLRDRGQLRLIDRLRRVLSPAWLIAIEAPFPTLHDLRSWDALLRLGDYLVGVEAETRLRDQQEFLRRIRQRELHGGVDEIVIVLSDSAHNRQLIDGLREGLGGRYATPQRVVLRALRDGRPLPGSGVLLL